MGGLTRSRTLYLIALLALVVLSVQPVEKVDASVERAFLPARLLGLVVAPFGWLRAREVRAAEAALSAAAETERESCRVLLVDEQDAARPTSPELARGRILVPVRFVERVTRDKDAIVVRYPAGAFVRAGSPVVCGDVYVGRVRATAFDALPSRTKLGRDEAIVDLVTGRSFRVGARVVADADASDPASVGDASSTARLPDAGADSTTKHADVASATHAAGDGSRAASNGGEGASSSARRAGGLVVGGLVASPADDRHGLYLAAHVPSDRSITAGRVHVHEGDVPGASDEPALADGFLLGELERYPIRQVPVLGVRAALDYATGLHQMFVLAPEAAPASDLELAHDPFEAEAWLPAELLPAAQPSFWRAGQKLAAGTRDGVYAGVAVAAGARWIGRVISAGPLSAEVGFAGDPGLVIHALARIEGERRPVVLGELVGIGRDGDGVALFGWEAVVPIASTQSGELAATLYTSSESRKIPPGLAIGTTKLPRGRGSFVLRVDTGVRAEVRRVLVWRTAAPDAAQRIP